MQNKVRVRQLATEHGLELTRTVEVQGRDESGKQQLVRLEVDRPVKELVFELRQLGAL